VFTFRISRQRRRFVWLPAIATRGALARMSFGH